MDPRYIKLAKTLCGHSTKVAAGEHVLIDVSETPSEMVEALIDEVVSRGAFPHVDVSNPRINRALALAASDERLAVEAECSLSKMKKMDAYIAVRGSSNIFENSDVPQANMAKIAKAMKPSVDWRVNKTRWVVLRWPTCAMAQQAQMSSSAFEDFYFDVCTMDYDKMEEGMQAVRRLMESTDKVRIYGNGTDLSFSIKSIR